MRERLPDSNERGGSARGRTGERDHTMVIGMLRSVPNNPGNILKKGNRRFGIQHLSQEQDSQTQEESTFSLDKGNDIDKTCVVASGIPGTPMLSKTEKLSLQRRKTVDKGNHRVHDETNINVGVGEGEKRLTLQRRIKVGNSKRTISMQEHSQGKILTASTLGQSHNLLQPKYTDVIGFRSSAEPSLMQKVTDTRSYPVTFPKHASVSKEQENVITVKKEETVHKWSTTLVKKVTAGKSTDNGNKQKTDKNTFKVPTEQNVFRTRTLTSDGIKLAMKLGDQQGAKHPSKLSVKAMAKGFQTTEPKVDCEINNMKYSGISANNGHQNPLESGTLARSLPQAEVSSQRSCTGSECSNGEDSAVTVAVRVRPLSNREKNENAQVVVSMKGQDTVVKHPDSNHTYSFAYDFSFWSFDELHPEFSSQETVYNKIGLPLLEKAFDGYNTCLFAYGQTGSGKSYTMMGFSVKGVIPRFCEQLFARVTKPDQQVAYCIEMSYFEVYNEKIHDLLVGGNGKMEIKQSLRVREHPVFGPYVADLSLNVVTSYADIHGWLELGNKQRATAATGMNEKSSRSHSVFTLVMTQTKTEFVAEQEHEHSVTSRINLVDLAGSERCFTSQTSGNRLKEGVSINKSLFTLGKVISALSEYFQAKKKVFIPYRESVLTWLLKDSLGGNSKTAMIATISPSASNVEETLSTLRYAKQARQIINVAKVNEDSSARLIRDLKLEIEKLKAVQMSSLGMQSARYKLSQREIEALKLKLRQQEREMAEAHRKWRERLDDAEKRKLEEARELQKAGITFKVDNSLPNLVNLNEDPQISEMLLYMIKEGSTRVGKQQPNSKHDIQLSGALIADDHCIIQNLKGAVSIAPIGDANTYVNGHHITESTALHHGDRVILGGDHYFKFNHPLEVQSGQRASSANALHRDAPKDFEFARNELMQAQQARLEVEIEEARLQAKQEMMQGIQLAKQMAQEELCSQKSLYENKIRGLEEELVNENRKKKEIELLNVKKQLQQEMNINRRLEQELEMNRKRLEMEASATRQALQDHNIRHVKFLDALEAEKRKMAQDLERMQQEKRWKTQNITPCTNHSYWNSMKLSVMVQEANTISNNLRKHTVFSRHETDNKNESLQIPIQVQVKNIKLGISTFWSLEKFECKLAAMRELYQGTGHSGDEDIFYDPNDDWETDLTLSSSFSKRRSKSFFKSKRMSGCLAGIQALTSQNMQSTHTELLNMSQSMCPVSSESKLPAICKEILGAAVDFLGRNHVSQENIPDRLVTDLLAVHQGTMEISNAYEKLDEGSQENLFTNNQAMQTCCIRVTSNFERVTILVKLWIDSGPQDTCFGMIGDELLVEVRTLGRNLQLLLQGCDSDISSMVVEAWNKIRQTIRRLAKHIGHLAAFMGMELHSDEENVDDSHSYKRNVMASFFEGARSGMESLLDIGLKRIKEHQKMLQKTSSNMGLEQLKKRSMALSVSIQNCLIELKKELDGEIQENTTCYIDSLKTLLTAAAEMVKFNESSDNLYQMMTSVMRGDFAANEQLKKFIELVCSSVKHVAGKFGELWAASCDEVNASFAGKSQWDTKESWLAFREIDLAASSLLDLLEYLQDKEQHPRCTDTTKNDEEKINASTDVNSATRCSKGVKKSIYTLQGKKTMGLKDYLP
ncbi:kinesin-like protein KIF14 isoform X3 [Leucoraja erinacea]|uniref:kinesin-like protein KIF14 isoform X3 n=1 Tax=Leucoraja erinaceus TaxID=7782 RepID=UPI002457B59A|nr:kinesin-like protein KIF14 isoform X3 [Leucoraja erinacea]